jgi:beta-1,4-mannosyl-glycoprotein beta-1,4-N-acetylglucosaminyltransferase
VEHSLQPSVRIYDTFLFDGELDLLEFRLQQNYDETDFFVLVEAEETYRGEPKLLSYSLHQQRFAWAADKVRPLQLKQLGNNCSTPKQRAQVQRNAILFALRDARPEDVVLLLDSDEIPSLSVLRYLRTEGLQEPHRLQMTRHYQKLDLLAPASTCCIDTSLPFAIAAGHPTPEPWGELKPIWSGRSGVAAPVKSFLTGTKDRSPYWLRFGPEPKPILVDAGRHLTAVDPSAHLSSKLGRVFHEEWATGRGMYLPHLLRCEEHAVHHRGWWYAEQAPGSLPEDLHRLATAYPATLRQGPLPSAWRRRAVRTWAWIRTWRLIPERTVRQIDRKFDRLLPILLLPLLCADVGRSLVARSMRGRKKADAEDGHLHH